MYYSLEYVYAFILKKMKLILQYDIIIIEKIFWEVFMRVELISVGTELLLGDILNTNSQFLSRSLASLGINVYKHVNVGDNMDRIIKSLKEAFDSGADMVITTGGLGPTDDDITKEACAKYFGQELIVYEEEWEKIKDKFKKFTKKGENIPQNNIKQAMFTDNAVILKNDNGTAPGAIFQSGNKKIVMLPGPPYEMIPMYYEGVVSFLEQDRKIYIKSKYIRFYGIGESALEMKLQDVLRNQQNPTIALYAKQGEVLLRVTASFDDIDLCYKKINETISKIKKICGEYIYLIGDEDISSSQSELPNVVSRLLIEKGYTISISESCTGGLLTSKLASFPGISKSLQESCVTYSNEAKITRLGVSKDTLEKYGAVSSDVAREMAIGIVKNLGSDIGLATTGIAGPDGGNDEKPVGLVYFAINYKGEVYDFKKIFTGNRNSIRNKASNEILNRLRLLLLEDDDS